MKFGKRIGLIAIALAFLMLAPSYALAGENGGDAQAAYNPTDLNNMYALGLHTADWPGFLAKVGSAGTQVENFRTDAVWKDLEPSKGNFVWGNLDTQVNAVWNSGNHHAILMTVSSPTPEWARKVTTGIGALNSPPKNIQDWKDFCYAVATRYGDKVDFYEIWNEPGWDIDSRAAQQGFVYFGGNVETDYLPLMQAAYRTIKTVDPESWIACGALLYGGANPYDLYEQTTLYRLMFDDVNRPGLDNSLKVTSDQPVITERPMYFNYLNAWDGGHDVLGTESPQNNWYFAEGTTRAGFDEYLCLQNPQDADASVRVDYMMMAGSGANQVGNYSVPAHARVTVKVNDVVGPNKDVAMQVSSPDQAIVAERPMYFNYGGWTGGHDVLGAAGPQQDWYFAEGTTRANFDEYLCLQNPGAATRATVQFMLGTGENRQLTVDLAATSRSTMRINNIIPPDQDVSIYVHGNTPIICERPMYFAYGGAWTGGHDIVGTNSASTQWFFAEGTTRPNFDEYLCLQNPGNDPTSVTVTFMTGTGANIPLSFSIGARTRSTVRVNDVAGVGPNQDLSMRVDSSKPVICERPMYFAYQGRLTGGHDVMGAKVAGANTWYFAEGFAGSGFEQYLCVQNPGDQPAHVTLTFMMKNGDTIVSTPWEIPARSRQTCNVNNFLGLRNYCDAVSIHPYVSPENWGDYANAVNAALGGNGVAKQLMATEIGWPHAKDNPAEAPYYSLEGQRAAIGEGGLKHLFDAGVRKMWVYQAIDAPPGKAWDGQYCGLFLYNGTPAPAWYEYLKWQSQLP